eukprot:TRINITY_DN29260_c0_g7_i1.p1 TRINITY_DN29260_c0_g7~~TRINITY_DN29260_c0_g7_i1.p1  ORF type:complete len:258 (+),score=57.37 TRINITY_DN29260_c0_g7_i1:130-903(+)
MTVHSQPVRIQSRVRLLPPLPGGPLGRRPFSAPDLRRNIGSEDLRQQEDQWLELAAAKLRELKAEREQLLRENEDLKTRLVAARARAERRLARTLGENDELRTQNDELRQKILAAQRRAELKLELKRKENERLAAENEALQNSVESARKAAERRLARKRAENVVLVGDNDFLKSLLPEARQLAEYMKEARDSGSQVDWEELRRQKSALRQSLDQLSPKPVRTLPGSAMPPGSLDVTPLSSRAVTPLVSKTNTLSSLL